LPKSFENVTSAPSVLIENPGMGVAFFKFAFSVAISSVRNSAMLASAETDMKMRTNMLLVLRV